MSLMSYRLISAPPSFSTIEEASLLVGFWVVLPDVPDSVFPEGVSVSKGRWEAVVEPEQAEKLRSRANASESTDKMAGIFFIFKILSGVL